MVRGVRLFAFGFVVSLALCAGCRTNTDSPVVKPGPKDAPYFHYMEAGYTAEKNRDFTTAINSYHSAAAEFAGIEPSLRHNAEIAVHNRLAKCYASLNKNDLAAQEYQIAIGLGDKKYAPKALAKLRTEKAL